MFALGVEDPIKAATAALAADLPEVCKEIDQVYEAVNGGKSLGKLLNFKSLFSRFCKY